MLWLPVQVLARLRLLAPVALEASLEIVVLTVAADPAAIGEVKSVFRTNIFT